MNRVRLWTLLALAGAAIAPASAAGVSDSVLSLTAHGRDGAVVHGTAIVVARHGWILTSASLVFHRDDVTVSNGQGLPRKATFVAGDVGADLALLRIAADLPPLLFAAGLPDKDSAVSSLSAGAGGTVRSASGVLGGELLGYEWLLKHSAVFGPSGYGGALLNACGEAVGLDRVDPVHPGNPPSGYAVAAPLKQLEEFVGRAGVSLHRAPTPCGVAPTAATAVAEQAAAPQAAPDNPVSISAPAVMATPEDLVAAKHAARARRLALWALGAGVVLLIGVALVSVLLFLRRGRVVRRAVRAKASSGPPPLVLAGAPPREPSYVPPQLLPGARDILLEGSLPDGSQFTIKIPALALCDDDGAVIGRNPEGAEFVIARERVSRRHCRLYMSDGRICIADMGSTNGTMLNGQFVQGGEPLQAGDVLLIGDVSLRIVLR